MLQGEWGATGTPLPQCLSYLLFSALQDVAETKEASKEALSAGERDAAQEGLLTIHKSLFWKCLLGFQVMMN